MWFAINFVTRFLNYNDHLQLHCNLKYFYNMGVIEWIAWIIMDITHHSCNRICMELVQLNCNKTPMQLVCNYYCNVMLTFFIHPSIMMNFADFRCNSFATTSAMETHKWFNQLAIMWQLTSTQGSTCVIVIYPICYWQLGDYTRIN